MNGYRKAEGKKPEGLSDDTLVRVKCRDGQVCNYKAGYFDWSWNSVYESPLDIVKWKLDK